MRDMGPILAEIERLKADIAYWNNEHYKETVRADKLKQQISAFEAWQSNSWDSHLQIESLKAITELAIKGLKQIVKGDESYHTTIFEAKDWIDKIEVIADTTLSEIERLTHE